MSLKLLEVHVIAVEGIESILSHLPNRVNYQTDPLQPSCHCTLSTVSGILLNRDFRRPSGLSRVQCTAVQ